MTPETPRDKVLYLYGITERPAARLPVLEGVDGQAGVEAAECAGLVCWISRVGHGEFAERLAENMENLEWLAAASVRHQRVVSEIAARGAVLPARFGTVFLSEKSLASDAAGRQRQLREAFRRIADADEWGVKVFAQRPPPAAAAPVRSGKEYLQRKAVQLERRPKRELDPEVESLAAELQKLARASTAGGKVSAGQRDLEWQASFLLPRRQRKQWQQVLSRFAARWRDARRIECTGPWPPYSFVSTHGQ